MVRIDPFYPTLTQMRFSLSVLLTFFVDLSGISGRDFQVLLQLFNRVLRGAGGILRPPQRLPLPPALPVAHGLLRRGRLPPQGPLRMPQAVLIPQVVPLLLALLRVSTLCFLSSFTMFMFDKSFE